MGHYDAGHAGVHQRRVLGAITGFIAFHVFSDPIDGGRYVFAHAAVPNGEWGDHSEISCRAQWSFVSNLAIHTGSHIPIAQDCTVASLRHAACL